jgi:hypothetical protein
MRLRVVSTFGALIKAGRNIESLRVVLFEMRETTLKPYV